MFIKSIRNKLDVVQSKQVGIILPESKQAVTHRWCGGWSNPVPADQNVGVETQQWRHSRVGHSAVLEGIRQREHMQQCSGGK